MALDIAPLPPLQHGKPNEEASQTKAAQVAIQERRVRVGFPGSIEN